MTTNRKPVWKLSSPMAHTLSTFEANLYKAACDRESVTIGGGEFNYHELRTILGAIQTLRALEKEQNPSQPNGELSR